MRSLVNQYLVQSVFFMLFPVVQSVLFMLFPSLSNIFRSQWM